jgi:hypothetical protein
MNLKALVPDVALRQGICTEASVARRVLPFPAVISALSRIPRQCQFIDRRKYER